MDSKELWASATYSAPRDINFLCNMADLFIYFGYPSSTSSTRHLALAQY